MTLTLGRRLAALEALLRPVPPAPEPDPALRAWGELTAVFEADRPAARAYFDTLLAAAEHAGRNGWDGTRLFEAVGCDEDWRTT